MKQTEPETGIREFGTAIVKEPPPEVDCSSFTVKICADQYKKELPPIKEEITTMKSRHRLVKADVAILEKEFQKNNEWD